MISLIAVFFILSLTKENPHIYLIHCVSFKQKPQISTLKDVKTQTMGRGALIVS